MLTLCRAKGLGKGLLVLAICIAAGCGENPAQLVASAREHLAHGERAAAAIQLRNALQAQPGLGEARYLLGRVSLELGDGPTALKELRRALEAGYAAPDLKPLLARARVMSGDAVGALQEFGALTVDDPQARATLDVALGDAQLALGEGEKALARYQRALEAVSDKPEAHLGIAKLHLRAGDVRATEGELELALAGSDPFVRADAHSLRAVLRARADQPDEALAELGEAIRERPDSPAHHFQKVSLLLRLGRSEAAEAALGQMRQAVGQLPTVDYLQAFLEMQRNRLPPARDAILKVLRAMPDFLPARLMAGAILLRLGDHLQAQSHLARVLERAPDQLVARRLMVMSLLAGRDPGRAAEALQPLLARSGDDPAVQSLAGKVYLAAGEFERAARYFEKVVATGQPDSQALTRLALARFASGDAEQAFDDLEAASRQSEGGGAAERVLVMVHLQRREFDAALAALARLEAKRPADPETFNLKGGVHLLRGELAPARVAFEKALALAPAFLPAVVNLARIDVAEKHPEEAVKRFEMLIAREPGRADPYVALAELKMQTGAPVAGIEALLQRAIAASPLALSPRLALARLYLRESRPRDALTKVRDAQALAADDPAVAELLGRTLLAVGEPRQAVVALTRLVELQPGSARPLLRLADAQMAAGDVAEAEQSLRRALGIERNSLEALERLIVLLGRSKRFDEGVKVARDLQQRQPGSPLGHVFEGDLLLAAGQASAAGKAYREAIRIGDERIAGGLYLRLLRGGQAEEAERLLAQWVAAHPDELAVRGIAAQAAGEAGRIDEALRIYRVLHKIAPKNPEVLNNLAWALGRKGDPAALEMAQQALALAPDNPAILDTVGMLLVEKGDAQKGLEMLQRAHELASASLPIQFNLARAYLKADRRSEARAALESIARKAPEASKLRSEAQSLLQTL